MPEEPSAIDAVLADADLTGDRQVPALSLALLAKSADSTAGTLRQLYESERHARRLAEARLALARDRILNALDGPFQPSDRFIRDALYPLEIQVERYLEANPGF